MKHKLDYLVRKINKNQLVQLKEIEDVKANLEKNFKFPCKFKDGKCQGTIDNKYNSWIKSPACCCSNCKDQYGYLKFIPEQYEKMYKDKWTNEDGFWSSSGCKLPRRLRSEVCSFFLCNQVVKEMKNLTKFRNCHRKYFNLVSTIYFKSTQSYKGIR